MDRPLPVLPPHPAVYIASQAALGDYLRERGVRYRVKSDRIVISLDIPGVAMVDAYWLSDQVRFVAQVALDVSGANPAELALAIEKVNQAIGFPVWRLLPTLSATYTVTLDHAGALSSRVVEYAVALLRDALVIDRPVFAAQPGVKAS